MDGGGLDAGGVDGGGLDAGGVDGGGVDAGGVDGGGVDRRAERADRTAVVGRRLVAFFCVGGAGAAATSSTAGGEADGEGEGSKGNTSGTPSSARLTASFLAPDSSVSAVGARAK